MANREPRSRTTLRGPVAGESAEEARRRAEENAQRRARVGPTGSWNWLLYNAPTAEELTPEFQMESGDILLGPSAAGQASADARLDSHSMGALDALLQQVSQDASGVMDHGDRASQGLADVAHARAARGASDAAAADTSQSGASVQEHLQGLGVLNDGLLNNYTSIYGQDQAAALDSLMAAGQGATAMRGQTFGEQFRRGSAVDAFNAANLEYQRGVEQRNTDRRTGQSAAAADAAQQSWENQQAVRRGRDVVNDTQVDVDDAERHREKDETLQPFYAATGTVNGILG